MAYAEDETVAQAEARLRVDLGDAGLQLRLGQGMRELDGAERVAEAWGDLSRRGRCDRVRPKISESVTTTNLAGSMRNPRET